MLFFPKVRLQLARRGPVRDADWNSAARRTHGYVLEQDNHSGGRYGSEQQNCCLHNK